MRDQRQIEIERLSVLIASLDLLEARLENRPAAPTTASLERLLDGQEVDPALRAEDVGSTRQLLTAALSHFEKARHLSRVALMKVQVDEGISITKASDTWGVTRQLVSRDVNRPDSDDSDDSDE